MEALTDRMLWLLQGLIGLGIAGVLVFVYMKFLDGKNFVSAGCLRFVVGAVAVIFGLFGLVAGCQVIFNDQDPRGNDVKVKYRDSRVPVYDSDHFVSIDRDPAYTVKNAWYDSSERYLVITLTSTNYHYCQFSPAKWNGLKKASSMDSYYLSNIKGKYDCRMGSGKYVPGY